MLRLVYKDYVSSFNEVIEKDRSVTIHNTRNLKSLIEICKVHLKISPLFIRELVTKEDTAYNTRSKTNGVLDANNRAEIYKTSSEN